MTHAPIALFAYNRPWHTRQAIESLLANEGAAATDIFIFSDAPKNEEAKPAVTEIREYLRSISGFKSMTIVERETNWGLARSIIDGVSTLCEQYGKVIVVEDDLVTSPHFLSYMNKALALYENDEQVMQVAGYFFPMQLDIREDSLLLPFTSSWGWATWSRAWKHFDAKSSASSVLMGDSKLRNKFDLNGRYPYFKMLMAQIRGETQSWAIRWYLSVFMRDGLVLYPKRSLVANLGFDGSGVNCVASGFDEEAVSKDFSVGLMPELIALSSAYSSVLEQMPKPRLSVRGLLNRFLGITRNFFR